MRINSLTVRTQNERHREIGELFKRTKNNEESQGGKRAVLLLLLSRFSRVRLCVTPQTAAHQAPPSLGFSKQVHWMGYHFLLQCMKVRSESEITQSCPTLRDPMDCSLSGSSVHGIFQARVLEWVAIAFSKRAVSQVQKTLQ